MTISPDTGSLPARCCLAAATTIQDSADGPVPVELAWLQALHAVELCQRVAELAARCGSVRWPSGTLASG
jgi:hypothetical protein